MASATQPVKYAGVSYIIEFSVVLALYVGAVLLRPWLADHAGSAGLLLMAKSLPAVPIWLMLIAVWRYYRRIDEFEQKRLLETLAISFGIASCAVVTYGFLADAGLPQISITWAWPTLAASWLLTAGIRGVMAR